MEYHLTQTFSSLFPVRNNIAKMILLLKDECQNAVELQTKLTSS